MRAAAARRRGRSERRAGRLRPLGPTARVVVQEGQEVPEDLGNLPLEECLFRIPGKCGCVLCVCICDREEERADWQCLTAVAAATGAGGGAGYAFVFFTLVRTSPGAGAQLIELNL